MAVWESKRKILGTNPMAFACPRPGHKPLVWDQASSVIAQGEVLNAAERGLSLPAGVGLDGDGRATTDPHAVLDGGTLLPFGGHKGSSIAFMIEILAGALTGGCLGFEDRSGDYPGAQTPKAGQAVILIDPTRVPRNLYFARIETLFAAISESGVGRLPAERRYVQRERSLRHGIVLSDRSPESGAQGAIHAMRQCSLSASATDAIGRVDLEHSLSGRRKHRRASCARLHLRAQGSS
jgi:delta1-piperideine-2-carboxylate reductase